MEKYIDLQEKVLLESKKLAGKLGKIENVQDLVNAEDDLLLLLENISFFKVLERNTTIQFEDLAVQNIENEEEIDDYSFEINEEEIEEEVIFNNELNEINANEEFYSGNEDEKEERKAMEEENALTAEHPFEKVPFETETEEPLLENIETEEPILNEFFPTTEASTETTEDGKKEIFDNVDLFNKLVKMEDKTEDKKLKLAKIRGVNSEDSLSSHLEVEFNETSSILKSNVSTEYMEAERPKQQFKLDINDRIAFTKTLFNGSQAELNETINRLNSFKSLDEAKEYLSEIYYQKKWDHSEEYAQRLWSLVENKFQ